MLTWTRHFFVARLGFRRLSNAFLPPIFWSWRVAFSFSMLFPIFACLCASAPLAPFTPVSINLKKNMKKIYILECPQLSKMLEANVGFHALTYWWFLFFVCLLACMSICSFSFLIIYLFISFFCLVIFFYHLRYFWAFDALGLAVCRRCDLPGIICSLWPKRCVIHGVIKLLVIQYFSLWPTRIPTDRRQTCWLFTSVS